MKPSSFDSIDNDTSDNLQSLAKWYTTQIHKLFINLLEKNDASDSNSIIKIQDEYEGFTFRRPVTAGYWFIRVLLFQNNIANIPEPVKKLNEIFLKKCKCNDPQNILDFLSIRIISIAQKESSIDEWMKIIEDFSDCQTAEESLKDFRRL